MKTKFVQHKNIIDIKIAPRYKRSHTQVTSLIRFNFIYYKIQTKNIIFIVTDSVTRSYEFIYTKFFLNDDQIKI